ncbi:hypothetical protein C0993_008703 [Termitomyces sp. T159_Od127]|nr:hypothetical protein C0993_008703 [Termitomyces sp. T159_Od127]
MTLKTTHNSAEASLVKYFSCLVVISQISSVAHKIYGVPQTINTANYVFFLAYKELISLRDQGSFQHESERKLDTIVTGIPHTFFHNMKFIAFTQRNFSLYIAGKASRSFGVTRLNARQRKSISPWDYVPLVNLIGVYFQIRDDLMNLLGTEYTQNKGYAEDLTEGKFSFPVVHSIHADKTNRQVLNVLQKRPTSPTLKSHIIEYMRTHTRSFEYTFAVLETLEAQTREEIRKLGGNVKLEEIMNLLSVLHMKNEGA